MCNFNFLLSHALITERKKKHLLVLKLCLKPLILLFNSLGLCCKIASAEVSTLMTLKHVAVSEPIYKTH